MAQDISWTKGVTGGKGALTSIAVLQSVMVRPAFIVENLPGIFRQASSLNKEEQ